ncbi:MAG: winged helix-turn-helix transcriptional regulator, partial [Candidatus Omnitrophica bacterium]|nr:winged helix-turn-helix transcriptional regulator [Candidatus Omnitrophota bacterium]
AEEEAKRKAAEEEATRKAAEEEAKRKAAEEEATRKAAEEEAKRKAAEEEAKRKAAEEEAKRKAAEEEATRKEDEEKPVLEKSPAGSEQQKPQKPKEDDLLQETSGFEKSPTGPEKPQIKEQTDQERNGHIPAPEGVPPSESSEEEATPDGQSSPGEEDQGIYKTSSSLRSRHVKLLAYLKENESISRADYAKLCAISVPTAARDLKKLTKMGLIKAEGPLGPGRIYMLK